MPLIFYCGLLMGLGAFSIDIMLPAFPVMSQSLQTNIEYVELAVPIYLLFSGLSQLFSGMLADRWGRRVVLFFGLSIFILGSVQIIYATTIEWFLLGRVFQGFGSGCSPVIARAILRDLFQGRQLINAMSVSMTVFSLAPLVAPLAGSFILIYLPWEYIFFVMGLFGLFLMISLIFVPETLAKRNLLALKKDYLIRSVKDIYRNPQSRFFLTLSGILMIPIIFIVTTEARIYESKFGVSGMEFSILFSLQGVGILIGQKLNRFFVSRIGISRVTFYASCFLLVHMFLFFLFSLSGYLNAYSLCFFLIIFFTHHLVILSNASSQTMDPHGEKAGFTSSFYGFYVQSFSTGFIILLAWLVRDRLYLWSGMLLLITVVTFGMLVWWRRKEMKMVYSTT